MLGPSLFASPVPRGYAVSNLGGQESNFAYAQMDFTEKFPEDFICFKQVQARD